MVRKIIITTDEKDPFKVHELFKIIKMYIKQTATNYGVAVKVIKE